MTMQKAVWDDCPGIKNDGKAAHSMRDHCSSCAPFWGRIPKCPHCGWRLFKVGRTKCAGCERLVLVEREG